MPSIGNAGAECDLGPIRRGEPFGPFTVKVEGTDLTDHTPLAKILVGATEVLLDSSLEVDGTSGGTITLSATAATMATLPIGTHKWMMGTLNADDEPKTLLSGAAHVLRGLNG